MGDWVNESQAAVVSTSCTWAKGGNFLDREFTMKTEGRPVLSGTQRIGWDPLKRPVQDLDLRLRGRPRRRLLHAHRQPVGDQGRRRRPGRTTRVGDQHHHAPGQGPHELAVDRTDRRRLRGPRDRRVHDRAQATRSRQVRPPAVSQTHLLSTRIFIMNRTLSKLALGITLALLSLSSDVLAGRGGGYRGGWWRLRRRWPRRLSAARWAGDPWATRPR